MAKVVCAHCGEDQTQAFLAMLRRNEEVMSAYQDRERRREVVRKSGHETVALYDDPRTV